ncbi:MAG TPA: hypothetical protein VEQ63_13385, partial [Bryobacteraceae bacterium]|nr:hypothetical protein [Bryobacteraceae bacterium]
SQRSVLTCSFEVRGDSSKVQALLLDRIQANRFHRGGRYQALYTTGFQSSDQFRVRLDQPGDFVLMLDNRLGAATAADVSVLVELTPNRAGEIRELPPERRRTVVSLSLLFLGAVIALFARFLMKATSQ